MFTLGPVRPTSHGVWTVSVTTLEESFRLGSYTVGGRKTLVLLVHESQGVTVQRRSVDEVLGRNTTFPYPLDTRGSVRTVQWGRSSDMESLPASFGVIEHSCLTRRFHQLSYLQVIFILDLVQLILE